MPAPIKKIPEFGGGKRFAAFGVLRVQPFISSVEHPQTVIGRGQMLSGIPR
jgi:hypothetical protein